MTSSDWQLEKLRQKPVAVGLHYVCVVLLTAASSSASRPLFAGCACCTYRLNVPVKLLGGPSGYQLNSTGVWYCKSVADGRAKH